MKTEITFAQVAHLYLRSDFKFKTVHKPSGTINERLPMFPGWYNSLMDLFENKEEYEIYPIFTSFENLIKPVKANKFVAELLGINEGDEYVMAEYIKIEELYPLLEDVRVNFIIDEKKMRIKLNVLSAGSFISTLLIAAGYNVYQIKDCKYE